MIYLLYIMRLNSIPPFTIDPVMLVLLDHYPIVLCVCFFSRFNYCNFFIFFSKSKQLQSNLWDLFHYSLALQLRKNDVFAKLPNEWVVKRNIGKCFTAFEKMHSTTDVAAKKTTVKLTQLKRENRTRTV